MVGDCKMWGHRNVINKTIVVSPHPDDELLGPGGTLLRRQSEGSNIGWLLVTAIREEDDWGKVRVQEREREIQHIRAGIGISSENFYSLEFPTKKLDQIPSDQLVGAISEVFKTFQPEEIYVPHANDIHSDHRIVFDAVAACSKWFRYPSIKRILAYETLSETDCILQPDDIFKPNVFIDITGFLEKKIELLSIYQSEWGTFPFPRSEKAVRALAHVRGAQSGYIAAEAFQLMRERS